MGSPNPRSGLNLRGNLLVFDALENTVPGEASFHSWPSKITTGIEAGPGVEVLARSLHWRLMQPPIAKPKTIRGCCF